MKIDKILISIFQRSFRSITDEMSISLTMIKKYTLIFFILSLKSIAQTITPEVIASDGDYYKTANTSISWTLGECVTESFLSTNIKFTQGFQQGNLIINSLDNNNESEFEITLYPNPSHNFIAIFLSFNIGIYELSLYDALGKNMLTKNILKEKTMLDFSGFSTGIYFLNVYNLEKTILRTFKVQKIN